MFVFCHDLCYKHLTGLFCDCMLADLGGYFWIILVIDLMVSVVAQFVIRFYTILNVYFGGWVRSVVPARRISSF